MDPVKITALYLDREEPGWASRIDLEHFNMANGAACIGGQLFGTPEECGPSACGWQQLEHRLVKDGVLTQEQASEAVGMDSVDTTCRWREEIESRTWVAKPEPESVTLEGVFAPISNGSNLLDVSGGEFEISTDAGHVEYVDGSNDRFEVDLEALRGVLEALEARVGHAD